MKDNLGMDAQEILAQLQGMTWEQLEHDVVPIRDAIEIISSKWKVEILTGIARGHTRFSDLKTFVIDASEKMLASGLRQLTELQLIKRIDLFGYMNRAEYRITEQGLLLFKVIFAMRDWGHDYRKAVFGEKSLTSE